MTFGGYSPEDYSRNRSLFEFQPDAECPRFLNELIYPAVEADDADLIQRWAGLALFGYKLPQRFLILDGTANGGKGTLVRIIQALVGLTNSYQLRTECLLERFETYRYRGKKLLIGPDVAGDFLMQKGASMLKSLVGGDPLSGEGKGLNGDFPMFGNFNVIMTCNSCLRVRLEGDTSAWRRRLLIVRYQNPPPENRILDFHVPLLREEASGILRWALAGFVKLQAEFATTGDFALTAKQRERVDSLLAESDSLRNFLQARVLPDPEGHITVSEIIEAYAAYCPEQKWQAMPITEVQRQLEGLMLELFGVSKCHGVERNDKPQRGFRGVKFRDEAYDEP